MIDDHRPPPLPPSPSSPSFLFSPAAPVLPLFPRPMNCPHLSLSHCWQAAEGGGGSLLRRRKKRIDGRGREKTEEKRKEEREPSIPRLHIYSISFLSPSPTLSQERRRERLRLLKKRAVCSQPLVASSPLSCGENPLLPPFRLFDGRRLG